MKIAYLFLFLTLINFQIFSAEDKTSYQFIDKVIAIVEKEVITFQEYEKLIKKNPTKDKKIILDELITKKMLIQYADNVNILPTNDQIEFTIESIIKNNQITSDILKKQLIEDNITYEEFKDEILYSLAIKNIKDNQIMPYVNISKYEIDAALNEKNFNDSTEYELQHILVSKINDENNEKIKLVINEFQNKSFSLVAKKYSDGPFAQNGGNMGWKKLSELPSIFVEHVKKLNVGNTTNPIKSDNGIHFLYLKSKRGGEKEKIYSLQYKFQQLLLKRNELSSNDDLETKINNIKNLIFDGLSFEDAYIKYSEEQIKTKINQLEWINESSLPLKFKQEFKKYPQEKLIGPFETDIGWHLIKIYAHQNSDISDDISRQSTLLELKRKKTEIRFRDWVLSLKDNTQIKILEE